MKHLCGIFFLLSGSILLASLDHDLVNVHEIIPTICCDIRYATKNNFTKQVIYNSDACYLKKEVALALKKVQWELAAQGLGLKIWDAYRPVSAQRKLWEVVPDERYVGNPEKGGRHTRGTAVDVTLIRLKIVPNWKCLLILMILHHKHGVIVELFPKKQKKIELCLKILC